MTRKLERYRYFRFDAFDHSFEYVYDSDHIVEPYDALDAYDTSDVLYYDTKTGAIGLTHKGYQPHWVLILESHETWPYRGGCGNLEYEIGRNALLAKLVLDWVEKELWHADFGQRKLKNSRSASKRSMLNLIRRRY